MKAISTTALVLGCLLVAASANAAERTVTLKVDGMTCASCPYIVKQSLASVDGVINVNVSFDEKTAVVTFDDTKTETLALTRATAGVGFPSNVEPSAQ